MCDKAKDLFLQELKNVRKIESPQLKMKELGFLEWRGKNEKKAGGGRFMLNRSM